MSSLSHRLKAGFIGLLTITLLVFFLSDSFAQRRGGGWGGSYYRSTPTYRSAPPRPMTPRYMQPSAPRATMSPRPSPNIPSAGGTVRTMPKSIAPNATVGKIPSYTGRVTTKGVPIVISRTGKPFSIPQKGIFSTRVVSTFQYVRTQFTQYSPDGRIANIQSRIQKYALGSKITTTQVAKIVNISSGKKGAWSKELNKPKPNTIYNVDERHKYHTDELGRVKRVEGKLQLTAKDRNKYQQCLAGKCGLQNDEGGHLIASSMGGAGEKLNLLPMNSNLNKGNWKVMENKWASSLLEGKSVAVSIVPVYTDDSHRPFSFRVEYKIDDGELQREFFVNEPGG